MVGISKQLETSVITWTNTNFVQLSKNLAHAHTVDTGLSFSPTLKTRKRYLRLARMQLLAMDLAIMGEKKAEL